MYDIASRLDLGLSCPEDLFDLEFFTDDPAPFFKFARVRIGCLEYINTLDVGCGAGIDLLVWDVNC